MTNLATGKNWSKTLQHGNVDPVVKICGDVFSCSFPNKDVRVRVSRNALTAKGALDLKERMNGPECARGS